MQEVKLSKLTLSMFSGNLEEKPFKTSFDCDQSVRN